MPIPTPRERLGSLLAGRYRLDRILAIGGMSVLFEGIDIRSRRPVAVKLVKWDPFEEQAGTERFLHETELTVELRHPHVVEVLDFGEDASGVPYLVMELLCGESLEAALAREARPTPDEILRLFLPIMGALGSAHDAGVVHRDVKPGNVFLSIDARGTIVPKLIDFGIAKSRTSTLETRAGAVLGTPEYMAPEQLAGATATVATDVWAMGAVLYRCVSGQAPYAGASSSEVFGKLARDLAEPLSASGFPPGFCAAIDRALARNPRHRYGSMGEFAAALVLTAREAGFDVPTALETSAGMKGIDWEVILGARTKSNTSNGARRRAWNAWSLGLAVATLAVAAWAGLGRSGRSVNLARRPVEAAGLRFSRDEASRVSEAVALKPKLGGVGPAPAAPVVTAVVHGAGRPPESPNRPKRPQLPRRPAPAGPAEAAYSAAELPVAIEW